MVIKKVEREAVPQPSAQPSKKPGVLQGHVVTCSFTKTDAYKAQSAFGRAITAQPKVDFHERVVSTTVAPSRKLAQAAARATGQPIKAGKPTLHGKAISTNVKVPKKLANVSHRARPAASSGIAKLSDHNVVKAGFKVLRGVFSSAKRALLG